MVPRSKLGASTVRSRPPTGQGAVSCHVRSPCWQERLPGRSRGGAAPAWCCGRQRLRRPGPAPLLRAQPVTLIARLRLDAALYAPAPPRQTGQNGRPPLKGRRLPALKTLLDLPAVSWIEVSAVRRHCPHGGTHVANGSLVLAGQAACAPALGLGPGPTGRIHSPSLALHRSVGGPGADPGMVCPALATGGHLSGGAGSLGRGDPTPVVGLGHCPYYANPDGALLLDHPSGPSSAATTALGPSNSGLVRQAAADLRGCHRSGAPPPVAGV